MYSRNSKANRQKLFVNINANNIEVTITITIRKLVLITIDYLQNEAYKLYYPFKS